MDHYFLDGKRYNVDGARQILENMLDEDGLFDDDGDPDPDSDEDDVPPIVNDSEEDDNVETDDLQDDVLSESNSDDSDEDNNDNDQYFTAKNGMKWKKDPPRKNQTPARNIIRQKFGPKGTRPVSLKDGFRLFITDEIIDVIIRETNREAKKVYAEQNEANIDKPPRTWKEINATELDAYIGLLLSAGAYRSGREDLNGLWSGEHGRPIFRATMPLKRFQAIMRFIRFDNRNTREERKSKDKLAAVRDVWEMFVQQLSSTYTPGFDLTIDEQLVGFRGNCPFRQYIKSKPAKYGIKIFWICDSDSAFTLKGQIYLGKQPGNQREVNQGARVVKDLVDKWKNQGRNIVADNFFSSVPLVQDLLSVRTTYVGTLRKNKVEIPAEVQPNRTREVFSSTFGFSGNLTLVSYVPKKSNAVVLLSTMHAEKTVVGEEKKPEIILHYNSKKGAVDTLDKMVATYSCKRNTKRWPLVLFFNMLDVAGVAAMIVWLFHNPDSFGNKKQKRRMFLLQLGRHLTEPYIQQRLQEKRCIQKGTKSGLLALGYEINTQLQAEPVQGQKRKRCQLCPRNLDKKIKTECHSCGIPICSNHSKKLTTCVTCTENF